MELSLQKAAERYCRTWFMPDLILVICDWVAVAVTNSLSTWLRFLRVMRLVRGGRQVVRIWSMMQKAKLVLQKKEAHLCMDISLLLLAIIWVNHVICCLWYSLGKYGLTDTDATWLKAFEFESATMGDFYAYTTSLHWALTQMTPGSMEVFPTSTTERVFNVCVLVFGLILGSSFVATLTSMMTQYRLHIETSSNQFMELQEYLAQQGVEQQLAMAIKIQVKHRLQERVRLKFTGVKYLSHASKALQEALWHSCCMKVVRGHAFLNSLNLLDAGAAHALCNGAMRTTEFAKGDLVFEDGADSTGSMFFVAFGNLRYDPGELAAEANYRASDRRLTLSEGAFVSEAALWTFWTHLGTLLVASTSEVLILSSSQLQEALKRFPEVLSIVANYGCAYHRIVNERGVKRSDLGCSYDNHEIISGMNAPLRLMLAQPILEEMKCRGGRWKSVGNIEALETEIKEGKSNLGFVDKEAVRTCFVVALRLKSCAEETPQQEGAFPDFAEEVDEERFLVKVGEVMRGSGEINAFCVLPAIKRRGQETAKAALDSMLATDFADIQPYIAINYCEGTSQEAFLQDSTKFGVRTRYLRTTYRATVNKEGVFPVAETSWAMDGSTAWLPRTSGSSAASQLTNGFACMCAYSRRCCGGAACASRKSKNNASERPSLEGRTRGVEVLAKHVNVLVLRCDRSNRADYKLYLWLTEKEFEVLSSEPSIMPVLADYVRSVQLDDICLQTGTTSDSPGRNHESRRTSFYSNCSWEDQQFC